MQDRRDILKKLIFGAALMISGVIGLVGWVGPICSEPLVRISPSWIFAHLYFFDSLIAYFFICLAIAGLYFCIKGLKEN